ncbi:restriction endonuclease subunit S [Pseudomonas capeferrum]
MNELPETWAHAEIGDLCTLINGRAFKSQEWSESGIPIIRIQNLNNPEAKFNYYSGALDGKHLIKNGDLLFAWSGTPGTSFGAHIWHGDDAALNQHIFKIQFSNLGINRSFFRYAINQKLDELIGSAQGGVGLRHITKGTFEKTKIAFPPKDEQIRIAQKLDELLAHVFSLKNRIDAIPTLLKRIRQSILATAISGQLTEEWRSQHGQETYPIELNEKAASISKEELATAEVTLGYSFPGFWPTYALEQLVEAERGIPYGIVQTGDAVDGGIPTVRCGDIKPLNIVTTSLKLVAPEIEHEYQRTRLRGGEVLLAIRGTVGNAGVVPKTLRDCNISREVAMIPVLETVSAHYLTYLLQSPRGQRLLMGKVKGVAQKGINLADVRRLPITLPSRKEQNEIIHRVKELFAFTDQLEAKVASTKARIDQLSKSILTKAFSGELTASWRDTNPILINGKNSADALLENIKAEREKLIGQPNSERNGVKKRGDMNKLTKDDLNTWVMNYRAPTFSFEELKTLSPDYEQLKECLFDALVDDRPLFKQKFDDSTGTIIFFKVQK